MFKPVLYAAILAWCASNAHAQSTTWNFSYTGLYSPTAQQFIPDAKIVGSFTGRDNDGDGIVALSELSAFVVDFRDYFQCAADSDPYSSCAIRRFSYALSGKKLDFDTHWYAEDEYYTAWYGGVTSGVGSFFHTSVIYGQGSEVDSNLLWTGATRFSIVPAPVPEPARGAMILAGLALLETARRRLAGRRPASAV